MINKGFIEVLKISYRFAKVTEVLYIEHVKICEAEQVYILLSYCEPGIAMSASSSRAESALRIFLMNALNEAESLILVYKSQVETWNCFPPANLPPTLCWDRAVSAAHRVIAYIQACLYREGTVTFLLYGLSAIGAAQEALVSALTICHGRDDQSLYIHLHSEHTLRAKFIVNGLIAEQRQDRELASLWVLAAQQVHMKSELKCLGNNNDTSIPRSITELTKQCLAKAAFIETVKGVSVEGIDLQQLAARYYRRAAVCAVLGRNSAYNYAAETYQLAVALCQSSVSDSTSLTFPLWQSAVASMRLAGDMIAVHTDEASAKNDPLITQTIVTAKRLAEDAASLPSLLAAQEEWIGKIEATKTEITKCRDPAIISVLKLLIEKQERVQRTNQQYLQAVLRCESQTDETQALQQESIWAKNQVSDLQLVVRKLGVLIHNAQYYRKQALQAPSVTHKEVRLLLCDFWSTAAAKAELLLQQVAELVRDGIVQTMAHDLSGMWQRLYDIVRRYTYVAEIVLGTAVEYLDKARGAEAGERVGRDPREAQMWRKAAECLVQRAELISTALDKSSDSAIFAYSGILQVGTESAELAVRYARAAEYFARSYCYKQQSSTHVHGQRISDLYAQLAHVVIQKYRLDSETVLPVMRTVVLEDSDFNFMFQFIELLSGSAPIAAEQMHLYEKGCEYGHKLLLAAYAHSESGALWKDAFEYCLSAKNLLRPAGVGSAHSVGNSVACELAVASVYALGAVAVDQGRKYFSLACIRAAKVMRAPCKVERFKMYHMALAVRILLIADSTMPTDIPVLIPAELQQLAATVVIEDPQCDAMLQEQAGAYCLEAECMYQASVDKAASLAWMEAAREVSHWLSYLELHAKQYHDSTQPTNDDTSLLAFYKLTATCYVATARHTHNPTLCSAWTKAVLMSKHVTIGHIDTATVAIECIIRAVHAMESGDMELSEKWEKCGRAARTVHERTVAPFPGLEASKCDFRHAKCNALAFMAQREERPQQAARWRKAATKWKEAASMCPLQSVDLKRRKDALQQEAVRALILEAEQLEREAQAAVLAPEVVQESKDIAEDSATTHPLPVISSAPKTAQRITPPPASTSFPAVSRRTTSTSSTKNTVATMAPTSSSASRPSSAQAPARRAVPSASTAAGASTTGTTVRRAGAVGAGVRGDVPARPLSSRSSITAGTNRTGTTTSAASNGNVRANVKGTSGRGAERTTSARK